MSADAPVGNGSIIMALPRTILCEAYTLKQAWDPSGNEFWTNDEIQRVQLNTHAKKRRWPQGCQRRKDDCGGGPDRAGSVI